MDDGPGDGHAVGIGTKKHSVEHVLSNADLIEQTQLFTICRAMPIYFNAESIPSAWEMLKAGMQMCNDQISYETANKVYKPLCPETFVLRNNITISSPAKKPSKWSPEEDALVVELQSKGMTWEDISKRLPGRSSISCRLHYQNYLERRSEWDEERKNKLARLYER